MFGFLEGFVGVLKTFGKTKQNKKRIKKEKRKKKHPRVCLKPLKTFVFGVPEGFVGRR